MAPIIGTAMHYMTSEPVPVLLIVEVFSRNTVM